MNRRHLEHDYRVWSTFVNQAELTDLPENGILGALNFHDLEHEFVGENLSFSTMGVASRPEGEPLIAEVWQSNQPVTRERRGRLSLAWDGFSLFGMLAYPDSDTDLSESVRSAYDEALAVMRELGYPYPYRMWNFLPRINQPDASGLERYRAFCKGRSLAFHEDEGRDSNFLPAGTCVGILGDSVGLVFLSCKRSNHLHFENPRQVPAYAYPQAYGPKAPSFARATLVPRDHGTGELYVSGTASIIGHQSEHHEDLEKQFQTTLDNFAILLGEENTRRLGISRGFGNEDFDTLKVYVRRPEHMKQVQAMCRQTFPTAAVLFLEADICREELLLEIEGVVKVPLACYQPAEV